MFEDRVYYTENGELRHLEPEAQGELTCGKDPDEPGILAAEGKFGGDPDEQQPVG